MKKLLMTVIVISVLASCKKDDVQPVYTPTPPLDDARNILLKTVVEERLPNPLYKFVYDAGNYVTEINYADGFNIYAVTYENKRVKKLVNSFNHNEMRYFYDNGQVTRIEEFNAINIKLMEYTLGYNTAGKLVQVTWKDYRNNPAGSVYKQEKLFYHTDNNLARLELYYSANGDGVLELLNTKEFSDYDDKVNVSDFYLLEEFFDSFLFLPQVKLQVNNPRREKIFSSVNAYEINYTYQFNSSNLPVTKSVSMTQTSGTNAGQAAQFTHQYTYY